MARLNRFAAATALAAAFSLAASPAMARGYHHHHRWHRDRVDGGDILAGALIIGGIAAIANAANKRDREERAPPPPPVQDDRQGYAYDAQQGGLGLDRAADMCADAAEREGNRVDFVDNVTRDREGWAVSGALETGAGFSCRIGNDGRVENLSVGGSHVDARPQAGEQEDDVAPEADDRPVWRGDDQSSRDDGRYSTSDAPDFGDRT